MILEGCLDQLYDHMVSSKLLKSNSPTGRTKPSYRAKKPGFFPCINTPNVINGYSEYSCLMDRLIFNEGDTISKQ